MQNTEAKQHNIDVDRDQIAGFVRAVFLYAEEASHVVLRSFYEGGNSGVLGITPARVTGDLSSVIDAAYLAASKAARSNKPAVFCPPVATFASPGPSQPWRTREEDLQNGLTLSVECDAKPTEARKTLEAILGPATVVVRSGGLWTDPNNGEVQDKLHLHWRLTEPTTSPAEHAQLKRARELATTQVSADPSSIPIVHPMRWPGSVHRKHEPRLATIVALNDGAEVELTDALELLESAVQARDPGSDDRSEAGQQKKRRDRQSTGELVALLVSGKELHRCILALAMRSLMSGTHDGQVVELLRGLMCSIPDDKRNTPEDPHRWQARYDDIPRAVRTARSKLGVPPVREHPAGGDGDLYDAIPIAFSDEALRG